MYQSSLQSARWQMVVTNDSIRLAFFCCSRDTNAVRPLDGLQEMQPPYLAGPQIREDPGTSPTSPQQGAEHDVTDLDAVDMQPSSPKAPAPDVFNRFVRQVPLGSVHPGPRHTLCVKHVDFFGVRPANGRENCSAFGS